MSKFALFVSALLLPGAVVAQEAGDSADVAADEPIELREVVVKGQSTRVEAGKVVFTPGDLSNVATKGWEVLEYTPMLKVGDDDKLSYGGKGVKAILINGQAYPAPPEVIKQYLSSFPPGRIKKIEILTLGEPVVNVVLKDTFDGLLGSAEVRGRYADDRVSPDGSLWLGTSYGRLRASVYGSGRRSDSYSRTDTRYDFGPGGGQSENDLTEHNRRNNVAAGAVLNWNFSKHDELRASYGLTAAKNKLSRWTSVALTAPDGISDGQSDMYSTATPWNLGMSANVSYQHNFGENGGSLVIGGGWNHQGGTTAERYTSATEATHADYDDRNTNYYGLARYERSFGFGLDLSAMYQILSTDKENTRDDSYGIDAFDYNRLLNSLSVKLTRRWSGVFASTVSVNARYTKRRMTLRDNPDCYRKSWLAVQPTVALAFNLPRDNSLTLNFMMSQGEPQPVDLDPFVRQLSENEFTSGNPWLENSKYCSLTASWMFLRSFMFAVGYTRSTDMMKYVAAVDGDRVWNTPVNIGSSHTVSAYLNYWKAFFKNRLVVSADATWIWDRATTPGDLSYLDLISQTVMLTASVKGTISARHKLSATLSYSLTPPSKVIGEFRRWDNSLSLKVTKAFGFGGNVSFTAGNLANSGRRTYFESPDYSFWKTRRGLRMSFALSMGYTFGSKKVRRTRDPENPEE